MPGFQETERDPQAQSGATTSDGGELELQIAHLLLLDIVGYSKLLVNEQIESVRELNCIARGTSSFSAAEKQGKLVRVPTGDGMALLFFRNPEEPVYCALEIAAAMKNNSKFQVRMGIHSGPVNTVTDVNDSVNVAGTGINVAQRVMDCGDAGHILLSKHIADDLSQYRHWHPYLQDCGECEVKHGLRLHITNLYKDGLGNPARPQKLRRGRRWNRDSDMKVRPVTPPAWPKGALVSGLILTAIALAIGFSLYFYHRNLTQPAAAVPTKSIAVLPFRNLSNDQENAFFADGVQDEILTDLAKIADLKVISRTSVMAYKSETARNIRQVGRELGVAHVMEGTVQRAGDRVRVSAQLIDARTDTHLWAEHYDRPITDIFAMQSEIAQSIADQLRAKISPTEKAAIEKSPTTDLTAYNLYLRAKTLFADTSDPVHARQKLPEAIHLLDETVARDPNFLQAWCLLSRINGVAYFRGHDHTPQRLELANSAAQAALRLQPDAGEAHFALASYYYFGFRDYKRARSELNLARRTLPNDAEVFVYTGFIDRREGRWAGATQNMERALDLDPRNFFTLHQLALTYLFQHRYADAARTYAQSLTVAPGDPVTRILRSQVTLDWRADINPWQTTLAALIAENPSVARDVDNPNYALCERTATASLRTLKNYPKEGTANNGVNYPHAYWEGVVAHLQGDSAKAQSAFLEARTEVQKTVENQPDFASALSLLGMIDAGLGRKEEALREGRHACELLPISKDAVDGVVLAINLAQIYAWLDEKNLAIEQIAMVESGPNALSYGLLKLHPFWDLLRGDKRFEKIVNSLSPKP